MNLRPTDYESVALPLSYTGSVEKLAFSPSRRCGITMAGSDSARGGRQPLDPELRSRLLQEARTPWRGLRRGLWLAFTASGAVGLATMALRASSGEVVGLNDLGIQVGAVVLFGGLLWFDRNRSVDADNG